MTNARNHVPKSSYAQLQARRLYYRRNRAAVLLQIKLQKAGVRLTMAECRAQV